MNYRTAAAVGGAIAGIITTAVMVGGRQSGILGKTLDRNAVDWIDRTTGSREVIGDSGTSLIEFSNHIAASAAFGYGFGWVRERAPEVPSWALGALYGTGLYLVNIGLIAPRLGITEGEREAGFRLAGERLGVHLLQTVLTALLADRLSGRDTR